MTEFQFTAQQITVLDALAFGASINQAAAEAGVHRNTIGNWRRDTLGFQFALANAQYDRALLFREKAEEMTDLAFTTLRALMDDPKTSSAVRLKAALAVVNLVTTQMPPQKKLPLTIEDTLKIPTPVPAAPKPQNLHNSAQSAQPKSPAPVQTIRREQPKIGRNDACPCGSGLKHKRCCLDKPVASHSAAA